MALTVTANQIRPLPGAIVRPGISGESLTLGNAVYLADDEKWYKAQANLAATAHAKGIVVGVNDNWGGTIQAADGPVDVAVFGPLAGISGMDEDLLVYLDDSADGGLVQTAPSGAGTWTHIMGYPIAEDVLMLLPRVEAPDSNS